MKKHGGIQKKISRVLELDYLRRNPREGENGRRGSEHEERALKITKELLENELSHMKHPTWEVSLAPPFSTKDRQGYDIVIPTNRGEIGIQIKSSLKALEEFSKKFPSIPCIVVNETRTDGRLTIEIRAAISHQYQKL